MIVPVPMGSTTDAIARLVASKLGRRLGQHVVVDNRPRDNGLVAAELVVNAEPDGYTLLMGTAAVSTLGTLYPSLPFDVQNSLAPIALLAASPYVVVLSPLLPFETASDLIVHARANAGSVKFTGSTRGSLQHLTGERLKLAADFDMRYVPYEDMADALSDLLSGRLHVLIDEVHLLAPYIRDGSLRGLGVTSGNRSWLYPDLPRLSEIGVPEFDVWGWLGVFGTANTPQAVLSRLHSEINALMNEPDTRRRVLPQNAEVLWSTSTDLRQHLAREIEIWRQVIRASGVKVEQDEGNAPTPSSR